MYRQHERLIVSLQKKCCYSEKKKKFYKIYFNSFASI